MHRIAIKLALMLALAAAPPTASALNVLLTNDDGQSAPGIQAMRAALCAAGHPVTLVAPQTDQSGRGGSINTGALSSSSAMLLTRVSSDACGVQYSLAAPTVPGRFGGTPVDALKTGLDVLMTGSPPDLIVSGLNRGQNLGKPTSNASGTVGAALQGAFRGIPAIAGSVGILLSENPGFASTLAAFAPAADFMVDVINALENDPKYDFFPEQVKLLNINFPVPYANITGVEITQLADRAELELPLFDRSAGFPPLLPPAATPDCAALIDGGSCSIGVGVVSFAGPDVVEDADTDAHAANLISITPMDGDMTVVGKGAHKLGKVLEDLTP